MNELLYSMINRGSIREFDSSKNIPQDHLDLILQAVQQSPTYINGQQYSIITITDTNLKDKMVELTMPSSQNPQYWIKDCSVFLLFVMDFNKIQQASEIEKKSLEITNYIEGLMIGTVDCGIALQSATIAAESLGYGTVTIGAVRKNIFELIEIFNLPKMTFPIIGLCIGIKKEGTMVVKKPRLPLSSFVHQDIYQHKFWPQIIEQYNQQIINFQRSIGSPENTWSKFVSQFYSKAYFKELSEAYKKQGFDFK